MSTSPYTVTSSGRRHGEERHVRAEDGVDGILGPAQFTLARCGFDRTTQLLPVVVLGDPQRHIGILQSLDQGHQLEQFRLHLLEFASLLVLVLQCLAEPEQRHCGRVRIDLERAPRPGRVRVEVEVQRGGQTAAARSVRELGLAGVGRVGAGLERRGSRGSMPPHTVDCPSGSSRSTARRCRPRSHRRRTV